MKYKYYIGIGAVCLVVLALILWPAGTDLGRLQEMYDRGQHEAVYTHLDKVLQKQPGWHEARNLMVKAALKGDRPDLALLHITELARAEVDTAYLEGLFEIWLREFNSWRVGLAAPWLKEQIELLPKEQQALWLEQLSLLLEQGKDCSDQQFMLWLQEQYKLWEEDFLNQPVPRALLAAAREGYALRDWEWIRWTYLELLSLLGQTDEIPQLVKEILAVQDGIANLWLPWAAVAQSDPHAFWELSIFLESKVPGNHRLNGLFLLSDSDFSQLAESFPEDALLAAVKATKSIPGEGYGFLRQWEEKYQVDAGAKYFYSIVKAALLADLDRPSREDFRNVEPSHLLQVAVEWLEQPEKSSLILDFLASDFPDEVSVIRAGLKGPAPREIMKGSSPSLSPDGKVLGYYDSGPVIYDLTSGTKTALDTGGIGQFKWVWQSDSNLVAVSSSRPQLVEIFDCSGKLQQSALVNGLEILGWRSSTCLLVSSFLERSLHIYNLDTEEYYPADSSLPDKYGTALFLGPSGSWATHEVEGGVTMQREKEVISLDSLTMRISSWLPDGSGLLLSQLSEGQRFYLWRNGEPEKLGIQGRFMGWRNDDEFYWVKDFPAETEDVFTVHFGNVLFGTVVDHPGLSKLMGYNIKTGEIKDYNLPGNWDCAGGKTAVSAGMKIRVYIMP